MYRSYHAKKIEDDAAAPKKICMDEFHRTKNCQPVRNQTVTDIREGRKFDVQIALLSQMVDDFDASMIELVTNIFILSKGIAEDTITKIIDKFKPSTDAIKALKTHVTGPTKEGSSMLYKGSMKGKNSAEMVIRLTLGPVEVWAYSTTHEDVMMRNKLTKKIGLNNALRILSREFPGGTAKPYIQSRNFESSAEVDENIYDVIVAELVVKHKDLISI
jgi:intracellular multiplication protein IcmB